MTGAPERSNILFLLPDQLRADFLGCYDAGFGETPHIDALCAGGVRYERAISPSPLCVPARASLLTGLNAIKNGVLANDQWLRPDRAACGVKTWPELLGEAGYATAAIGKMHFYPWDASEGFERRVIAEDKRHIRIRDDYHDYLARHGHRKYHGNEHEGYFEHKGAIVSKIPAEHQVDTWVADEARRFIEGYDDARPFALMVAFPGPHDPYDPPPELAGRFDPAAMPASIPATPDSDVSRDRFVASYLQAWNGVDYREFTEAQRRKVRAHYAALVHQIDRGVGRILAALDRRGVADRTIVVFASDHGDFLHYIARTPPRSQSPPAPGARWPGRDRPPGMRNRPTPPPHTPATPPRRPPSPQGRTPHTAEAPHPTRANRTPASTPHHRPARPSPPPARRHRAAAARPL